MTDTVQEKTKKSQTLNLPEQQGKSRDAIMAELMLGGIATNAYLIANFDKTFGEASLTDCVDILRAKAKKVHGGDLSDVETLLIAQASALDIIFIDMALRAKANMGEYLDAADRFLRLALKAQGQCRATLETLAAIKNPPVVIARQANVAHGPQQVNNNVQAKPDTNFETSTRAHAHAENSKPVQNELLEHRHDEHMDIGAPNTAVTGDPAMATVDTIHRPAHD